MEGDVLAVLSNKNKSWISSCCFLGALKMCKISWEHLRVKYMLASRCCSQQRDLATSLETLFAASQPFASHWKREQLRKKPAVPSSHLLPTCELSIKTHMGNSLK